MVSGIDNIFLIGNESVNSSRATGLLACFGSTDLKHNPLIKTKLTESVDFPQIQF
jgi:hypothetical protein